MVDAIAEFEDERRPDSPEDTPFLRALNSGEICALPCTEQVSIQILRKEFFDTICRALYVTVMFCSSCHFYMQFRKGQKENPSVRIDKKYKKSHRTFFADRSSIVHNTTNLGVFEYSVIISKQRNGPSSPRQAVTQKEPLTTSARLSILERNREPT